MDFNCTWGEYAGDIKKRNFTIKGKIAYLIKTICFFILIEKPSLNLKLIKPIEKLQKKVKPVGAVLMTQFNLFLF